MNNNSFLILKSTRPLALDHKSSMNMTYKNNVVNSFSYFENPRAGNVKKDDFFFYSKSSFNQLFSFSTLNSTWLLGPGHESYMDMTYKHNFNDNFSLTLNNS